MDSGVCRRRFERDWLCDACGSPLHHLPSPPPPTPGRVVASALVVGPLIHEFGYSRDDHDMLAAASIAVRGKKKGTPSRRRRGNVAFGAIARPCDDHDMLAAAGSGAGNGRVAVANPGQTRERRDVQAAASSTALPETDAWRLEPLPTMRKPRLGYVC